MNDIRKVLETLQKIDEGKYGAHGSDLDNAIDSAIEKLGDNPTIEEIYAEVNTIRNNEDIGGFLATRGYREAAALGAIAQALDLPGLYKDGGNGRTFVTTDQDDANRYQQTGSASRRDAETLAQRGYLTPEKAERLGLELPTTQDDIDAQGAAAADAGMDNQEPADDAPQTDDELDADSEDSGTGVRLSDGSSFDAGNERSRTLAAQRAGELIDRYRELMRKMNESAPSSIKGYLKEYKLLEAFLFEALNDAERAELRDIITDLNVLIDAEGLLSSQNQELFRREIADAPSADELRPTRSITDFERNTDSPEDADSADSGTPDAPPEADEVSADSGDQDATVEPGEGSTSSSLEAFASSGKGGLANDADETAAIEELQQFLTDMGIDPNGVDGKYGNGTINAVKEFQGIFGATQDGDAGPETIGKIVEYRNDLQEMDDLIAAASAGSTTPNDAAGGGDVESTVDSPVTASIDFRHLISLVEGKLFEALDDAQRTRAEELITKYEALVGNLPEPAKTTVQEKIDALKAELNTTSSSSADEPEDDAEAEAGDDAEAEAGDDAEAEAGEAVYKVVTGTGQGRRYTTFDANGNEVASGRAGGPNLPTQQEYEAQQDSAEEPEAGAEEPTAGPDDGTRGLASADEVWNQIKAMRDEQPEGPERTRLNRLMNSINRSTTTPEEAAEILAQAQNNGEPEAGAEEPEAGADPELPTVTNPPTPQDLEPLEISDAEQRILDSYDDEAISIAWPGLSQEDKEALADILQRAGRPVPGVTTSMSTGPVETDF